VAASLRSDRDCDIIIEHLEGADGHHCHEHNTDNHYSDDRSTADHD
jgi:hypothetical protein